MAVPKKKQSHSKTRMRRAHDGLTKKSLIMCTNCGDPVMPHRVCAACGYYKGKEIINTLDA